LGPDLDRLTIGRRECDDVSLPRDDQLSRVLIGSLGDILSELRRTPVAPWPVPFLAVRSWWSPG
jgi:hypothetical protein